MIILDIESAVDGAVYCARAGSVCEVLARLRALLGWKMVRVVSWFTTLSFAALLRCYFVHFSDRRSQLWEAAN
jgi:hypothetical protein